jgi:hypothetical protein
MRKKERKKFIRLIAAAVFDNLGPVSLRYGDTCKKV